MCPEADIDFLGNDLKTVDTDTWGQCFEKCKSEPACKAWTWVAANAANGVAHKNCLLKKAGTINRQPYVGLYSGTLACQGKFNSLLSVCSLVVNPVNSSFYYPHVRIIFYSITGTYIYVCTVGDTYNYF